MSKVSIVRCKDYEQDRVDEAIAKALDLIGGIQCVVHPGDKVLLKVNMLRGARPEGAVTTHPSILRSLIKHVKMCSAIPLIGDSPGNAYTKLTYALKKTGFLDVCNEEGAEIVNFDTRGTICINNRFLKLNVSKIVKEVDAIINLPKLKTHNYTLFTGAIKNMFGVVPGFHKGQCHLYAPHPKDFSELIVDVFSFARPQLSIMDAVYGMEGHGPSGGTPRYVGVILASFDSVALDAASSAIIGYDPLDIDIIEVAKRRGLGEADLSKISILGSALDDVKVKDFKLAQDAYHILRYLPRILHRPLKYLTKKFIDLYPKIDRERCIRCQVCVNACPPHVISSRDDLITIDYADCIRCYCCHELCPEKAISIERSFLAKRWRIGEGVRYG